MEEEEIWRENSCVNAQGMLSASRVKAVFSSLVRSAIEELDYDRYASIYKIFRVQGRSLCQVLAGENCETVQLRCCLHISIWYV